MCFPTKSRHQQFVFPRFSSRFLLMTQSPSSCSHFITECLFSNIKVYDGKAWQNTCLKPPPAPALPPVISMVRRDVTTPPPRSSPLPTLRMAERIEFNTLPYVVPCPRSMACMKQKVIAPVEVILDRACSHGRISWVFPSSELNKYLLQWKF